MNSQSIESKAGHLPFIWMLSLILIPLIGLFVVSFLSRGAPGSLPFTLENYFVVSEGYFLKPLFRSLIYACATTIISFLIALPVAIWIASTERNKLFLLFLVLLPFWTNFLIRLYGWKILLRENGFFDFICSFFGLRDHFVALGTPSAIVLGLLYLYLPLMIVPLYVAVEKFDWRIVLAAKDLGAGTWRIQNKILIPLIMPAIRTGALFVFVLSFGDFVVSDILGGARNAMIGNLIRDTFLLSRNWPQGAAITFIVSALAFLTIKLFRLLQINKATV